MKLNGYIIAGMFFSLVACQNQSPAPIIALKNPSLNNIEIISNGKVVRQFLAEDNRDLNQPEQTLKPNFRGRALALKNSLPQKPDKKISQSKSQSQPKTQSRTRAKTIAKTAKPTKPWLWPTQGKVVSHYQPNIKTKRGIDIAGKLNTPIYAVKAGKVVYAGNGLRGYGNMIIIKHDNEYLTAYAFNQTLLVKENDKVKVGQQIANMGRAHDNQAKLHFEIRKQGKPVDPLAYLG